MILKYKVNKYESTGRKVSPCDILDDMLMGQSLSLASAISLAAIVRDMMTRGPVSAIHRDCNGRIHTDDLRRAILERIASIGTPPDSWKRALGEEIGKSAQDIIGAAFPRQEEVSEAGRPTILGTIKHNFDIRSEFSSGGDDKYLVVNSVLSGGLRQFARVVSEIRREDPGTGRHLEYVVMNTGDPFTRSGYSCSPMGLVRSTVGFEELVGLCTMQWVLSLIRGDHDVRRCVLDSVVSRVARSMLPDQGGNSTPFQASNLGLPEITSLLQAMDAESMTYGAGSGPASEAVGEVISGVLNLVDYELLVTDYTPVFDLNVPLGASSD